MRKEEKEMQEKMKRLNELSPGLNNALEAIRVMMKIDQDLMFQAGYKIGLEKGLKIRRKKDG